MHKLVSPYKIWVLKEQGLYNPSFEHENCGAGFICSLEGKKTNDIISKALNILTCLEHRGAVSSDGRTGDGAGILIEIPNNFFKKGYWCKLLIEFIILNFSNDSVELS